MNEPNEEQMEETYDEGELSDDEFQELSFDALLDGVESNDPSLTKLKVRLRTPVQNDVRLGELATAIGRNTHLKAVMFYNLRTQLNEAHPMDLFRGITCNQSIKRFRFNNCGEQLGNACRILTPLFKNNQVERIRIGNCKLILESTRLLATSLAMFDSLKEFDLTNARKIQQNPESEQVARVLMQALPSHSGLRKLNLAFTNIGKLGCSALVDLLSNPNINLRVLDLTDNNLGDAEAVALSSGMAGNTTLKEINLTCNRGITEVGWQALFDALNSSRCRLEMIKLEGNKIDDAAAQSLSNVLNKNIATLKTLDLGYNHSITIAGWYALFDFLQSSNCALEDLGLRSNDFNDEVMTSLIDALANNRSLRSLDLSYNIMVTGDAWQRFFSTVLANPSSGLEKLDLDSCDQLDNDAAIGALTNALVNNSKLKVLTLNNNDLIAEEMFCSVLESPNTALEELDLQGNVISDDTRTSLVNSLANNKKLKKLYLDHSDDWEPPVSVLCNAASIMDTYNSNHILEKLGDGYSPLPEEFESLLQINRENSPSQAARLKIINTRFNEGFITQPFVGMDLNVLPRAMAWMSRDGEVSNHFYGFIRSMTSLFKKGQQEEEE